MLKFSIITVNYNNLHGLKRTINSVLKQTCNDFEFIVIDGGSNDGSADYLKQNHENISFWLSEPDAGIYNAMNKGASRATGEYLIFINSGDHFYSDYSLANLSFHSQSFAGIDIVYGDLFVIGEKQFVKKYPSHLSFNFFLFDTLPHPSTLIRKKAFEMLRFDESLRIVSDWKFFILGLSKFNFSYFKIEEVVSTFYLDGISSRNADLIKEEKGGVMKKEFSFFIGDYFEMNHRNTKNYLARLTYFKSLKKLLKKLHLLLCH